LVSGDNVSYDALVEHIASLYTDADLHFGHGTQHAIDEAWWTVCFACDIEADPQTWNGSATATGLHRSASLALAQKRIDSRQPLAYLINEAWFAGERYFVDERVLVPRSHLGDWIPEQFAPWLIAQDIRRILDIGTGSGCIAIALARAFPEAAVVATDISSAALDVARINADQHSVSDRIEFLHMDIYDNSRPQFDLIVSNPPYVNDAAMLELPAEYQPEPEVAFRGGQDGLQIIHRILDGARDWLSPQGTLVIEIATARIEFEKKYPGNTLLWLASAADEEAVALIRRDELDPLIRLRKK